MNGQLALPKPKKEYYEFWTQYDLAIRSGKRRFGSDCRHERVKDSRCMNCLRKMIIK
jgi:hypothetical protein